MKFLVLALCVVAAAADPHWLMMPDNEVQAVKSTWAAVNHDEVEILYAVFKAHPDIQARFPKFAGKDLDSIKGSADFAIHASRIVSFFNEFIALLGHENTQPAIKTILNQLGQTHRNRGITKQQFEEFHDSLTVYLKGHTNWNAAASQAWDDAFDKMYFVVFSALDGHPVA
uniref:Globin n=1 Tax=Polypedilum nubifer TaxID=54969 RepID=V5YME5_9DIPT|nr:globin [Polypedilum nubifer]